MKRLLYLFLLTMPVLITALRYTQSQRKSIYEITTLVEVLEYAHENSLVLFDIDNTLLAPTNSTIAGPEWFEWHFNHLKKLGHSKQEILTIIGRPHYAAQKTAHFAPIESNSDRVVEALQRKGIHTVGLTARGSRKLTQQQLTRARINLEAGAEIKNACYEIGDFTPPAYYIPGTIFANGNNKGEVLKKFLHLLKHKPQEIILVDDRLYNLKNVEKVAKQIGIRFTGLRYGYLDPKVNRFDRTMDEVHSTVMF